MPKPRRVKIRCQVNLDMRTIRVLDQISEKILEQNGRSAAIRYLAHFYLIARAKSSARARAKTT